MSKTTRNFLLTLVAVLAACFASFCLAYRMSDEPAVRHAAREGDAMNWLRVEFHLNSAQFAAIEKLHDDYGAVCAEHCAAITAAKRRAAPAGEIATLERACVDSMTAHFQAVAALMPAREGQRYLAMVLPRVNDYDHEAAPTVRGSH
jgi:hypothetical protein